MTQVIIGLHESMVEMLLNSANPSRPISKIIKDLEEIENKGHKAVNLDDARKLEHLAVELIRISRDTRDCLLMVTKIWTEK